MYKFNAGDKLISGIERFDDLPRSTKYFAASVGSLCTAVVTETVPNPTVVPFICFVASTGYLAATYRTFREDNPTFNSED